MREYSAKVLWRIAEVEALLYLGRKAAESEANDTGSLLARLADVDHPAVRFHALAASAKIGLAEESPIQIFKKAFAEDDPDVRFWAAHAWVELAGAEAYKATGALATAISEHAPADTRRGPTVEQKLAAVKARVATEALQRLGIRLPSTRR